jgi:hypothetical protein
MDIYDWLLEPDDPSVRYRTLVELLGKSGTEEAEEARKAIADSEPAKKLMGTMHPDGYWLQKDYKGRILGMDVEYGSFATTHFCLAFCAELGLDRSYSFVNKAAQRYLSLQQEDGDWWEHLSCLYGYNIRTFILLGYRDDERLRKAIDLMLQTTRTDGGYLCDLHEKRKGRPEKSCVRGAAKALLTFAELPEYWDHERCLQLVDYFMNRNGIFRNGDHQRFVNKDMMSDSFPITWRTNVWVILYALGKMGYGKDERLADAWKVMESRKDIDGRYILDWMPAQSPWKAGIRGEPNKWITLYCMLAEKYRDRKQ